MSGHIARVLDVSLTAPTLPTPHVRRPHLIDTLAQTFTYGAGQDAEILFVEAPSGWGKTTFLLEFADSIDSPCFGMFLKAPSRLSYDPVFARYDLADQVHWYLTGVRQTDDREPTDGQLRNLWARCAHKLQRQREAGYIIVDGFHHIPSEDESIRQALLNLLPFGVRPFRFLFSGYMRDLFSGNTTRELRAKTYPLPPFNAHEASQYFQDLIPDDALRGELHPTFGGVPGILASVRRHIDIGQLDVREILRDLPTDVESLFDAEWTVLNGTSDDIKRALAFIAAYGYPVDSQILSSHCGTAKETIDKEFGSLPFLFYSQKAMGWEFSSDSFRNYAERRLGTLVNEATEDIAEKLLQKPDSEESLARLPAYLERSGKTDALVDWLHQRRLAAILLKTRTAAGIEPTLRTAIDICHRARRDRALTTYVLSRSIIQQASQISGIEHEIRARGAIGDAEGALAIANDVPLLTQRMRLLAVTVDALSNSPGFDPTPLLEEIREIHNRLDFGTLSTEEVIDIATDLYPIDAELALNILKQVTQSEPDDSTFELAVTRVTVAALKSQMSDGTKGGSSVMLVPEDIQVDEKLRRLLEASEIFFHPKSASEVLEVTKGIKEPTERLFILRKWVALHPLRNDAIDVVESVVRDAISTPQFAPNASFYREITTPLPYVADSERRKKIVSILDGQKEVIENKGPIIDYVRLQLRLAECDYVDGACVTAVERLEELYVESIDTLDELESRITCLGWFISNLNKFDPESKLVQQTEVLGLAYETFEKTLTQILQDSADQLKILKNAIRALAISTPDTALRVCRRLNTIDRRTIAFREAVTSMCKARTTDPISAVVFKALDEMEGGDQYDVAIRETAKRFSHDVEKGARPAGQLNQLLGRLEKCSSSVIRTKCLSVMSEALSNCPDTDRLRTVVGQRLLIEFNSISNPRSKYRTACQLVSTLRDRRPDLSMEVFKFLADPDRETTGSEDVEWGIFSILDLLTKATYALAESDLLSDTDIARVCDMVGRVSDPVRRIDLLSTLAFYLWRAGESHRFSEVVNQRVWPALNGLSGKDRVAAYRAWRSAYPAVWLDDRDRARHAISGFPVSIKDDCIFSLSLSLLQKQPPREPCDDSNSAASLLTFPDIQNLLQLSEETEEDGTIFAIFEWIASDVAGPQSKVRLTNDQKAEIRRRMLEVSEKKLPMKQWIQHTGYQILCKAQALRISPTTDQAWQTLVEEAKALGNTADRVYVLAKLAVNLPRKQKGTIDRLLREAESTAEGLPTIEDRHGRLVYIASLTADRYRDQASRTLRKAFELALNPGSPRIAFKEHRLIDLAYRVDPELPMKLAMLFDDDPAREQYKDRAKLQLRNQQLRKDIGDTRSSLNLETLQDDPNLASATWRALGALNSGRMVATNMARLREMLVCASFYPLNTSYPIYSWVLSNALIRYSGTSEAKTYIRDLFEGILQSAEFFFSITVAGGRLGSNPDWEHRAEGRSNFIVEIGARDKAIQFLQTWLEESAVESIAIMDPYFNTEDLELLVQVIKANPHLQVQIITSKAHQLEDHTNADLPSAYSIAWRQICEQAPPETEILVVGTERGGVAPFHDRWMLSRGVGLRLGTSYNSLGNKHSEISVLRSEEVLSLQKSVDRYVSKQVREYQGERVRYQTFELVG